MATIEGLSGKYAGKMVELRPGRIDIGRGSENSLAVDSDQTLSRRHATIYSKGQAWFCVDLGSTNGTFLNGDPVGGAPQFIPSGSYLQCGQQLFCLRYDAGNLESFKQHTVDAPNWSVTSSDDSLDPVSQSTTTPPPEPRGSTTRLRSDLRRGGLSEPGEGQAALQKQNLLGDATWFGRGKRLSVQGIVIENPLVYAGRSLLMSERGRPGSGIRVWDPEEPSLVNPLLEARRGLQPTELPYWPTYAGMGPVQRWTYLNWLASDRSEIVSQGYLFVFFYGVERRLLLGAGAGAGEQEVLLQEIRRLRMQYSDYHSFQHYSLKLLAYFWPKQPGSALADLEGCDQIKPFFLGPGLMSVERQADSELLRWAMANHLSAVKVLRPIDAVRWTQFALTSRVVVQRCGKEIESLFLERSRSVLGEEVPLRRSGRMRRYNLTPANTSLCGQAFATMSVAEPDGLDLAQKEIENLLQQCASDLQPVAIRLGPGPSKSDIARAQLLLPPELFARAELAGRLRKLLADADQNVLLDLPGVFVASGLGEEPYRKDLPSFFRAIATLGYVAQPDPEVLPYLSNNLKSVAFAKSNVLKPAPSDALGAALLTTWLAATVASCGWRGPLAVDMLLETISARFALDQEDVGNVRLLLRWLSESQPRPSKRDVLRIAEPFDAKTVDALVEVARLTGLSAGAVRELSRLLAFRGWTGEAVYSALLEGHQPVTVREGLPSERFCVPGPPANESPGDVDLEKVRRRLSETREVSALLSTVFAESNEVMPLGPGTSVAKANELRRLANILAALSPGEIREDDLDAMIRGLGLPAGATIEDINSLALDLGCGLLIEGDNPRWVDGDTLQALRNEYLDNTTT